MFICVFLQCRGERVAYGNEPTFVYERNIDLIIINNGEQSNCLSSSSSLVVLVNQIKFCS